MITAVLFFLFALECDAFLLIIVFCELTSCYFLWFLTAVLVAGMWVVWES